MISLADYEHKTSETNLLRRYLTETRGGTDTETRTWEGLQY